MNFGQIVDQPGETHDDQAFQIGSAILIYKAIAIAKKYLKLIESRGGTDMF